MRRLKINDKITIDSTNFWEVINLIAFFFKEGITHWTFTHCSYERWSTKKKVEKRELQEYNWDVKCQEKELLQKVLQDMFFVLNLVSNILSKEPRQPKPLIFIEQDEVFLGTVCLHILRGIWENSLKIRQTEFATLWAPELREPKTYIWALT